MHGPGGPPQRQGQAGAPSTVIRGPPKSARAPPGVAPSQRATLGGGSLSARAPAPAASLANQVSQTKTGGAQPLHAREVELPMKSALPQSADLEAALPRSSDAAGENEYAHVGPAKADTAVITACIRTQSTVRNNKYCDDD